MTLMDYTFDAPQTEPSIDLEHTSWGYYLTEVEQKGWRVQAARAVFAGLTFGAFAAAGMVWTLADSSFPGDPAFARAILSTALYVIAAALVLNGAFSPSRDRIEVDTKRRVIKVVSQIGHGLRQRRKTIRFEEITRIDLAETSLLNELKSAIARWDYGRLTVSISGQRSMHLIGGDMAELENLLSRLRRDTGVA